MKRALLLGLGICFGGLVALAAHADSQSRETAAWYSWRWYHAHPTYTGPLFMSITREPGHQPQPRYGRTPGTSLFGACDGSEWDCKNALDQACAPPGSGSFRSIEQGSVEFESGKLCAGMCSQGASGPGPEQEWISFHCFEGPPPGECPDPPDFPECPTDPEQCPE